MRSSAFTLVVGVFSALGGVLIAPHVVFAAGPQPGVVGRYQLVAGKYSGVTDHGAAELSSVVRVDTMTGRAWVLGSDARSGAAMTGATWVQVNEKP